MYYPHTCTTLSHVLPVSALAASGVLRSLFGFAFPLFATQIYDALGINWATSLIAFLSLACTPFPFIFYKYGSVVRSWSDVAVADQGAVSASGEA